jgi:hypothetical protein
MDPLPLPRHGQHGKLISPAAPSGWSLRKPPHVKVERLERHGARRRVETWHFTYFTVRVFNNPKWGYTWVYRTPNHKPIVGMVDGFTSWMQLGQLAMGLDTSRPYGPGFQVGLISGS